MTDPTLAQVRNEDMDDSAAQSFVLARRLVSFFVELAEREWDRNNGNAAVAWASVAAEHAWAFHPGYFYYDRLERLLLQIAADLPKHNGHVANLWPRPAGESRRVLHVATTAYQVGGHAKIIERWAKYSSLEGSRETHSLVITAQGQQPLSSGLIDAIGSTGGGTLTIEPGSLLDQAAYLRALSEGADCLILHTHPHDPLPLLALGIPGGPPVYLMNATDHVFWLGISIADLVLDIRPSGQKCSIERRGARRSEILPIPLFANEGTQAERSSSQEMLGLPPEACVLLTIASAYKYAPVAEWNFVELVGEVLARRPDVHLLAAGPKNEWGWDLLARKYPKQVHALGIISDLEPLYAVADIYLGSLPFASITASLDACMRGLPFHRACNQRVPLMSNDDPAFEQAPCYSDPTTYINALMALIADKEVRTRQGKHLSNRIRELHTGRSWLDMATTLTRSVLVHRVETPIFEDIPNASDVEWYNFQQQVSFLRTFGTGLITLKSQRQNLSRLSRLLAVEKLLLHYPRYLSTPRLGIRVAIEILKN